MKVIKSYWKWEVKEKTFEKKGALSCLVEPQMNEETKQELQYSDFRHVSRILHVITLWCLQDLQISLY